MAARPIRSEIEGGLSGPAHPISDQELDCGCGQLPCPKLTKFATRKLFVGLVCWIGIIQACAQAYYGVTSSTMAREFQIKTYTMEWLSWITNGFFPFILALPIAYWGDRIHRAAWTGALVLLQSFGFILFIILHFTHSPSRIIEGTNNVTHLPFYAENHPELCSIRGLAKLSLHNDDPYITLGTLIIIQTLNCMANIAYVAFMISYLDDNTRRRHVAIPISLIIAVKIIGMLFGYLLAWGCLRIDSDNLNSRIESHGEQIGAWWLGWPILAICLSSGGLIMSWMPRRLISEVVEQAAASILDLVGRVSPISESTISDDIKYGDTGFFQSFSRLVKNKILISNILASVFCTVGLMNFYNYRDIYLESRFYVPKPTGIYLGFGDLFLSRIISIILLPIIIGSIIIISGVIIVKFRPRAKWIVGYNIIICIIAAMIVTTLIFLSCQNSQLVGQNRNEQVTLLQLCNLNCSCSKDTSFSPICEEKNSLTIFSPCHAGCRGVHDSDGTRKFTGCCIKGETRWEYNIEATEGPCITTTCQYGWIVFQVSIIVTYSLIASGVVGSLLIGLRSIYDQDKALAIGLWITAISIFVYIIGKMIYWQVANSQCILWGNSQSQCHLYNSKLGGYLAFVTVLFLIIGIIFELLTLTLCRNLRLYREPESEQIDVNENSMQTSPILSEVPEESKEINHENLNLDSPLSTMSRNIVATPVNEENNQPNEDKAVIVKSSPVYSSIMKVNNTLHCKLEASDNLYKIIGNSVNKENSPISDTDISSDEELGNNTNKRAPTSLSAISYRRLELDSDTESSVSNNHNEQIKPYRNNGNLQKNSKSLSTINYSAAEFSPTDDIEFTEFPKKPKLYTKKKNRPYSGDFNEVGIPIVDYKLTNMNSRSIGSVLMAAKVTKNHNKKSLALNSGIQSSLLNTTEPPTEHTSSGFSSSASDLLSTTIKCNDETSSKSQEKKSSRPNLPAISTAL